MEYLSLYRKWRPKRFDQGFVGQEHLVRTLQNAITLSQVAHAYLFHGPRGTGKTTAAKILAKALNCTGRGTDPNPCNTCPNCEKINAGVSLDVLEIDGASNRGIDEVRDLREKIKFAPVEGEYKVYIIDEVHMLTTEAFNALLKTLEEPPSHIIFIFATTEIHKVPATILSRCQRFDFKHLTRDEIFQHLAFICEQEKFTAEEAALQMIAREAGGGLRDAIGLLEQSMAYAGGGLTVIDAQAILGLIETEVLFGLAQAIADQSLKSGLDLIRQVADSGKDLQLFARQGARFFRDLLLLQIAGREAPVDFDETWKAKGSELSGQIGINTLKKGVDLFLEAGMGLKRGIEGCLPLEMALVQLVSHQEVPADLESLGKRLADLESRIKVIEAHQGVVQWEQISRLQRQAAKAVPLAEEKVIKEPVAKKTGKPNPGKPDPWTTLPGKADLGKADLGKADLGKPVPGKTDLGKSDPNEQKEYDRSLPSTDLSGLNVNVNVNWEEVLAAVRKKKRTVEALLREGQPGKTGSGRFVIEFTPEFKFHWENIKRPDNIRIVEDALREVTGEKIVVECLLKENSGNNSANPGEKACAVEEEDILRNTLELFGGTVVESE